MITADGQTKLNRLLDIVEEAFTIVNTEPKLNLDDEDEQELAAEYDKAETMQERAWLELRVLFGGLQQLAEEDECEDVPVFMEMIESRKLK